MNDRLAAWEPQATADSDPYLLEIAPAPLAEPIALNSRPEPAELPEPTREASAAISDEVFAEAEAEVEAETETVAEPTREASVAISDEVFAEVEAETVAQFSQDEFRRLGAGRVAEWEELPRPAMPTALAAEPPVAPETLVMDESTALEVTLDEATRDTVSEFPAEEVVLDSLATVDAVFDGVLDEMVDHFGRDTSALVSKAETPPVEPLDLEEGFDADEVFASDLRSEGTPSSELAAAESEKKKENRWTNAVRLTREAVVAWASLLHGPAVITISP